MCWDNTSVWKMYFLCLCASVCLLLTLFSSLGSVFWLICRFKTILLGLWGNPWKWIAFPLLRIHWQKIFFSSALVTNSWKPLEAWVPCPFFFSSATKCAQCLQTQEEAEDFFFNSSSLCCTSFCHTSLGIFEIVFFFFLSGCLYPLIFPSLVKPYIKKKIIEKKIPKGLYCIHQQ